MSKFGLIEGFYGKSYDFTSRHELISSMAGTDLNFYLYAPKEDPFLRNNFDLTPNESWKLSSQNLYLTLRIVGSI